MVSHDPPKPPNTSRERREQTNRIAAMAQQISVPLRELHVQLNDLVNEIKSNNKITGRDQPKYQTDSIWWTKFAAISATAFAGLSLIVTVLTLWILNNQFTVMRLDQRAWMNVSSEWQSIVENKPLKVITRTTNNGKTPARRIAQRFVVEILKRDQPSSLNFNTWHVTNHHGILVPNAPFPLEVAMLTQAKMNIADPPTLTKKDVDDFLAAKTYIVFYGMTTYLDIHGVEHWLKTCVWQGSAGMTYPARGCTEYNDTDRN